MKKSILIVDDEELIRQFIFEVLKARYDCTSAGSVDEAKAILGHSTFDLVLADLNMPGGSGLDLCNFVHRTSDTTVIVMMSGTMEGESVIDALRQGALDYVPKPFTLPDLFSALERASDQQDLLSSKVLHFEASSAAQRARTELQAAKENLDQVLATLYVNYRANLRGLARALEARDAETAGHSDRVVAYCLRIGAELGLTQKEMIELEQGALLHDIGKIGVRDSVLLKPGPLTDEEWVEMRSHVAHGLRIIQGIEFLSGARPIIGQHHEKFDGSGYPAKRKGEAIHLNARIFAVADAYDAIRSDRPYRAAQSHEAACVEICVNSGTHFDPAVVDVFIGIPKGELDDICLNAGNEKYTQGILNEGETQLFLTSLNGMKALTSVSSRAS